MNIIEKWAQIILQAVGYVWKWKFLISNFENIENLQQLTINIHHNGASGESYPLQLPVNFYTCIEFDTKIIGKHINFWMSFQNLEAKLQKSSFRDLKIAFFFNFVLITLTLGFSSSVPPWKNFWVLLWSNNYTKYEQLDFMFEIIPTSIPHILTQSEILWRGRESQKLIWRERQFFSAWRRLLAKSSFE